MADEELLESMDELGDEEEGEEEGGGSPLLKYLPLIGGVLVVQVIIGYVLVTLLFSPTDGPEEPVEEEVPTEVVEETAEFAEPLVRIPTEVYEQLDIIVVNPAGTEGLRFLSVKVNLGLASSEVTAFIDEKKLKSKISDTLISILASKTIGQLDPANHPAIKEEIQIALNKFLSNPAAGDAVLEVYFQSFVLQ